MKASETFNNITSSLSLGQEVNRKLSSHATSQGEAQSCLENAFTSLQKTQKLKEA